MPDVYSHSSTPLAVLALTSAVPYVGMRERKRNIGHTSGQQFSGQLTRIARPTAVCEEVARRGCSRRYGDVAVAQLTRALALAAVEPEPGRVGGLRPMASIGTVPGADPH
jgi:hypothetical protein